MRPKATASSSAQALQSAGVSGAKFFFASNQRDKATLDLYEADALTRSDLLVNTAKLPTQMACPVASTQPAQCNLYVRLSDNQPVTWPYYLPALGSEIIYTRDARLIDSDGDGIADAQDRCSTTPALSAVNSSGCALGEG